MIESWPWNGRAMSSMKHRNGDHTGAVDVERLWISWDFSMGGWCWMVGMHIYFVTRDQEPRQRMTSLLRTTHYEPNFLYIKYNTRVVVAAKKLHQLRLTPYPYEAITTWDSTQPVVSRLFWRAPANVLCRAWAAGSSRMTQAGGCDERWKTMGTGYRSSSMVIGKYMGKIWDNRHDENMMVTWWTLKILDFRAIPSILGIYLRGYVVGTEWSSQQVVSHHS